MVLRVRGEQEVMFNVMLDSLNQIMKYIDFAINIKMQWITFKIIQNNVTYFFYILDVLGITIQLSMHKSFLPPVT